MTTAKPRGNGTIRALVVDDSLVFQRALVALYEEDPAIRVLDTAGTARDAVDKTLLLKPDVISLDLGLPDKDGFEVAREVMAEQPTPILVLTATLNPSWRREAYYALTLGAVDVAAKPSAAELNDPRWRETMRERLKIVARSPVLPHVLAKVRARLSKLEPKPGGPAAREANDSGLLITEPPAIICVVGSAGSPRAITTMLHAMRSSLPLPVPIVVAMHLGHLMGASLARFLAHDLDIDARPLTDGELLGAGPIYIAPGGIHVELAAAGRVRLVKDLPGASYRPSLTHFLGSVAQHYGKRAVGLILTGMGDDGADGMLRIREAGGVTLAQDAESCLVASMPTAACNRGAVMRQLPPAELADCLVRLVARSVGRPAGPRSG